MQTGWRHNSDEVQREFERLRAKEVSSQQQSDEGIERGNFPGRSSDQQAISVRSPLESINVERNGRVYDIERFLVVYHNEEAVSVRDDGETRTVGGINFEDTASVTFQIERRGNNEITVRAISTGGGSGAMDSWFLGINAEASTEITNGETVRLVAGSGVTLSRTLNSITVNAAQYHWNLQANGGSVTQIDSGEAVNFTGTGIATVTRTGNTISVNVSAALAYSFLAGADIGADATIGSGDLLEIIGDGSITTLIVDGGTTKTIQVTQGSGVYRQANEENFATEDYSVNWSGYHTVINETELKPVGHTGRIWFDYESPGAGLVTLIGWYEPPGEIAVYSWTASDGTNSSEITDGETVEITGSGTITVAYDTELQRFVITSTYVYQWSLQAEAEASTAIENGETVIFTGTGVASVTRAGNTINVHVPEGAYSWLLQANAEATTEISTGETVTFTGTGTVEVTRSGNTITINSEAYTYAWNLQAEEGVSTEIGNGETVIFTGTGVAEVTRAGNTINVHVPPGEYSWLLHANGILREAIENGEEVDFVAGDGIAITGTMRELVISSTYTYSWTITDGTNEELIENGNELLVTGLNGVVVAVQPDDWLLISRPLTLQQTHDEDQIDVNTGSAVVNIAFENEVEVLPEGWERVFFVVTPSTGAAKVEAYFDAGTMTYSWFLGANGETPGTEIDEGELVDLSSGDATVEITRTGNSLEFVSPLTIRQTWGPGTLSLAVGSDVIRIDILNATEDKPVTYVKRVWAELTDDGGAAVWKLWYEDDAGGDSYQWTASDGTNDAIIANDSVVTWIGGDDITVVFNPGTLTFTINNTYEYSWNVTVDGLGSYEVINTGTLNFISGTGIDIAIAGNNITVTAIADPYVWRLGVNGEEPGIDVDDTEKVDFQERGIISIQRDGHIVTISNKGEPGSTGSGYNPPRVLMGYVTFNTVDQPDKPLWRYGHRKRVEIVHNWSLPNMHAYMINLRRVSLDENEEWDPLSDPVKGYFRSGENTRSGEDLASHRFEYIPEVVTIDRNTIAVEVTQSREKPTEMKFWFVLVGVW